MKYVLIIPDGMGDKPVKALKGKTPLAAARTPNMDYFASRGIVGLTRTIPKGFVPGTDIGSMSVFGYDPHKFFTGRGPLEAAVHGIRLGKNDLAFRCNLVTLEREELQDFSAGHIPLPEARILMKAFGRLAPVRESQPPALSPPRSTSGALIRLFVTTSKPSTT